MKKRSFFLRLAIISVSMTGFALEAISGPMGSQRSLINAVQFNARQAFRPTFNINSRHAVEMKVVAYAPGGGWFAAAAANGMVHVWETQTGQRVAGINAGSVNGLLFLPGSGDTRGRARVEENAPAPDKDKKAQKDVPASVAASDDNRPRLLTSAEDGTLTVWDTVQGTVVKTMESHGPVTGMSLLPDGSVLVTGKDGSLTQRNLETGAQIRKLPNVDGGIRDLSIASGGEKVALVGGNGQVLLVDMAQGTTTATQVESGVAKVVWSPDRSMVVGALEDGGVIALNPTTGQETWKVSEGGDSTALAFSNDGKFIAVADEDGVIRVWTMGKGVGERGRARSEADGIAPPPETTADSSPEPASDSPSTPREIIGTKGKRVNALAFSPSDVGVLTSAADDRMVRFWSADRGAELARVVAMRSGWAAVAPEGFFDGTLDGEIEDRMDALSWDIQERSFTVDGFLESYYRPGLLGRLLMGQELSLGTLPNVAEGFTPPPKVTLEKENLSGAILPIVVTVEDLGSGIGEVRLFHNGKVLDPRSGEDMGKTKGNNGEIWKLRFMVPLVDGSNAFQGVALSRDRIESEMVKIIFDHTGGNSRPPATHLVTVGINRYKNPKMNLNFGTPDAKGVRDFFSAAAKGSENRLLMDERYDEHATRPEILKLLETFKDTAPQDTVVVYLAGHGESEEDVWYFITHDVDWSTNTPLKEIAMPSSVLQEAMTRMSARNVLLLLDACKSGGAVNQFSKLSNNRSMAVLSRSTGIHIVAATTGVQLASELEQLGHGVFTYAMLEGLKGAADTDPRDSQVSVKELTGYLRTRVPSLTRQYRTGAMEPVINMRGENFVLARTGR
ncbi:MAG: peptidase C14, caspase catalytic subunit p20 [Magnetococcales bacterium]|nr:peptidase C14, caspase catalytic subunit p20 [Magnetococcales bacterium]